MQVFWFGAKNIGKFPDEYMSNAHDQGHFILQQIIVYIIITSKISYQL